MPERLHLLRFFRDAEARLRELVEQDPRDVGPALVTLANEIAIRAAALKDELIAEGLIPSESDRASPQPKKPSGNG